MGLKSFGFLTGGIVLGGGLTYFFCKKKSDKLRLEYDILASSQEDQQKLNNELSMVNEQLSNENNELKIQNDSHNEIITQYIELVAKYQKWYGELFNLDMIADITSIRDIETRDQCLACLEQAMKQIEQHQISLNMTKNTIPNIIHKTTTDIRDILLEVEDEEDDEFDEDIQTLTLSKVHLKSLTGDIKVFDVESDEGFEVLDGSDPEGNDYCIMAQNIPALYKFLRDNIKTQLNGHYSAKIDSELFDIILDDIVITISLSLVTDQDAVVTSVDAVIPFEIFDETIDKDKKVYLVENGELDHDNILKYFQISSMLPIKLTDELIDYISENTGFAKESLSQFHTHLASLKVANSTEYDYYFELYETIIREIISAKATNQNNNKNSDGLTHNQKTKISGRLQSMVTNMENAFRAEVKRRS